MIDYSQHKTLAHVKTWWTECECDKCKIVRGELPRYRLRYKKTLKKTGNPIVVWDMLTNEETTTNKFNLDECKIEMKYGNAIGVENLCGATTILTVFVKGITHKGVKQ